MSRWALMLVLITLCRRNLVGAAVEVIDSPASRDEQGGGEEQGLTQHPTKTAQRMANDFQDFFQVGIKEYDTSSEEQSHNLSTVALWHHAISKLDIPDEDDESASNLDKMKRLLSSVVVQIGDAAYPDPSNPEDPNHIWKGKAGDFYGWKNRANHDSLNHMRQSSVSLHFVHLLKRHRPDLLARILNAHGIEAGTEDERVYLLNIFLASYFRMILRFDEKVSYDHSYMMSDGAKKKLVKYLSPEQSVRREQALRVESVVIAQVWLFQRLAQTDYYNSLFGKHLTDMTIAMLATNPVEDKFTNERGNPCTAMAVLHDENGNEYDLDTVADDVLAAHFDMAVVVFGHRIDNVRVDFSHFTRPKGCGTFSTRLLPAMFFRPDETQRIKEVYSFWTYLTQQAGIVSSSETGNGVFRKMKAPSEIIIKQGKTFFKSNRWAKNIYRIWRDLASDNPTSDEQKKFHALCKSFDLLFSSFFAKEHLRSNLDEETAKFFEKVFWPQNNSYETKQSIAQHSDACAVQ